MSGTNTPKNLKICLIISCVTAFLASAVLLIGVTYSWIKRDWSSSIIGDAIKIEANGALAFMLDENGGTASNAVNVTDVIGMSNFVLKPVSNFSGRSDDFFTLDKTVSGNERYMHLVNSSVSASGWTSVGKANGYIEFRVLLIGENILEAGNSSGVTYDKYIYLNPGSYIGSADGSVSSADRALRISVTDEYSDRTYIFMNSDDTQALLEHTAVTNEKVDGVWIADGVSYRIDGGRPLDYFEYKGRLYDCVKHINQNEEGANLYRIRDFSGGITENEDGNRVIDPSMALLKFTTGEQRWVTVRVWLEGSDIGCNEEISGMQIKLFLSFEAVNCLPGSYIINELK